jgi:hypothetical protein
MTPLRRLAISRVLLLYLSALQIDRSQYLPSVEQGLASWRHRFANRLVALTKAHHERCARQGRAMTAP